MTMEIDETDLSHANVESPAEDAVPRPLVSIVIPVFNGSDYLAEAIDSALAQTYTPIEVVVVNDGSADDGQTERIALSYGSKIRYFSKPNGGVASALNFAISQMKGSYFSWLSHDDLYYPDKVSRQVEALREQGAAETIVYGDAVVFTDDPEVTEPIRISHVPPAQFRHFLTVGNGLHGCTLLIPKVAFEECGLFDESLRTTQDYDMWFRLADRFGFVHLPVLAVKARRHAAQGTITMKDTALAECNQLLATFVEKLTVSELGAETGCTPSIAYLGLAENLEHRGFHLAARHALSLAKRSVIDKNMAFRFVIGVRLSLIMLAYRARRLRPRLKNIARNIKMRLVG